MRRPSRAEELKRMKAERLHNYRILDENGVECWAGELAQRYRLEAEPRVPIAPWYFR